jgi:hypothetical protein
MTWDLVSGLPRKLGSPDAETHLVHGHHDDGTEDNLEVEAGHLLDQ